jgi:hypothetical protein
MPGQTPALWKPFETWIKQIADSIASRHKRDLDRFDEEVRTHMVRKPARLQTLHALSFEYSANPAQLEAALNQLAAEARPPDIDADSFAEVQNRKGVRMLLRELRASLPEDYGYYLYQRGLIPGLKYWLWRKQGKSKIVVLLMTILSVAGFVLVITWFTSNSTQIRYHQWRFMKPTVSERDRFRAREYLAQQLGKSNEQEANTIMAPMLHTLPFKEVSPKLADNVLRLVVDLHSPTANAAVIPQLFDALRTENADVRLRIHRTLLALQKADYPGSPLDAKNKVLTEWVPGKDESAGDIDARVHAWRTWWTATQRTTPGSLKPVQR